MSGLGKRVDGSAGRRSAVRRRVEAVGSAVTLSGATSVVIENLSPKGAKLVGRDLPEPGKEILVRTDELAVLGRIAWASRDERGIEFQGEGAPSAGECLALEMRANAKL